MIEARIRDLLRQLGSVDTLLIICDLDIADKAEIQIVACTWILYTCDSLKTCNFKMIELVVQKIEMMLTSFNYTDETDIFTELSNSLEIAREILADMPPNFVAGEARA